MNFSNVEQVLGNGHIQVCVAGTASGISIICIGSIVERTKGSIQTDWHFAHLCHSRVLSERTMLGSSEACPLTSKDIRGS